MDVFEVKIENLGERPHAKVLAKGIFLVDELVCT
jgi:hypothetical protein